MTLAPVFSASQFTGKACEGIVTTIVQANNKHNNRLLTLGEIIAVPLQFNPAFRRRHSIYIAALTTWIEPSGSARVAWISWKSEAAPSTSEVTFPARNTPVSTPTSDFGVNINDRAN